MALVPDSAATASSQAKHNTRESCVLFVCLAAVRFRANPGVELGSLSYLNLRILLQDGSEESPRECGDAAKIEIGAEGRLEGRTSASDLSGVSSTSDHCILKCTAGDALLDALNDPSVLELFPGDTLDGGMEDFQVTQPSRG